MNKGDCSRRNDSLIMPFLLINYIIDTNYAKKNIQGFCMIVRRRKEETPTTTKTL